MNAHAKHIIFDWNSTLLDDFPIIHECMNHIMQHLGRPSMTLDHFRSCYEVPFELLYTNLGLTDHEVDRVMNVERNLFHDHYEPRAIKAVLREGAVEILQHMGEQGLGAYILSNHIVDPIRTQLRRLSIEHFFTDVLAYATRATQFADMTKGEHLRQYRAKKNITSQPAIIIGDSVEEVQIARAEGLISVAITGGGASEQRLRDEKPDYLIHSLHELKPILQERGFAA